MSIPYPGTSSAPRSQTDHQLAGLAGHFIEQRLDDTTTWDEVRDHLMRSHAKTRDEAARGVLMAVLDLEWDGTVQYDTGDKLRRPRDGDATAAPLKTVAQAVLDLGWPPPEPRTARSVYECFEQLAHRYRHCDVYWAMHEELKGTRLKCTRRYWSLVDDATILADPTLTVAERTELEQQLEADLCSAYIDSLDHPVRREYPLNDRRADIFDAHQRLIIEAKAYVDDVVVLGAITQAMLYRAIANQDADVVDKIAILLPGEPSLLARRVAVMNELDAEVIWYAENGFRQEPLA